MIAKKMDYLKGNVFYVYDDEDNQIATVNDGVIIWTDGEEPYRGAAQEVIAAVEKAS